jgi:hypothetical protein
VVTQGARNALVLVLTLLVVALLFLFPTSWNHTGTKHRPGAPRARTGVVTPGR